LIQKKTSRLFGQRRRKREEREERGRTSDTQIREHDETKISKEKKRGGGVNTVGEEVITSVIPKGGRGRGRGTFIRTTDRRAESCDSGETEGGGKN